MSAFSQDSWKHSASGRQHEWLLKRNCSLSPACLALVFAGLAGVSLSIAALFAMMGAWWVLVFSLIEISALAVAFVVYARHAADYERVVLNPEGLWVETCQGSRLSREQYSPALTRVVFPDSSAGLIGLVSTGRRVDIGRFVPASDRRQLARQLQRQLQGFSL